jgi:hypothetical protein
MNLEEERWTFLEKHSTLDPCLLDMHALELDIYHLELQCFTCGNVNCLVRLLGANEVPLLLLTSLTFRINKGRRGSFDTIQSFSLI